jgi:hypothetical protein
MRNSIGSLLLLPLFPLLAGCSIAMALHGQPEPNFEAFEEGSSRKQVEIQLGTPIASEVLPDGNTKSTYQYEMGNSPNGGRATIYFYYDLLTIGLAEPIFTIIELVQGHKEESRIIYDSQERIVSIQGYTLPQPSAALKDAMEGQEQYKKKP